jgi:FkbM family methyltransferase
MASNKRAQLTLVKGQVKRLARPLVLVFHTLIDWVDIVVRRPQPWRGNHHPVFEQFVPWEGTADRCFAYDFLGVRTDPQFRIQYKPDPPGPCRKPFPQPSFSYFELIAVLQAVVASAHNNYPTFTMIELGAAYGHWMMKAHAALRQHSEKETVFIGVEMDPTRYGWMFEHFANNGVSPAVHRLVHAAVSDFDGVISYTRATKPDRDYGLQIEKRLPSRRVEGGAGTKAGTAVCIRLSSLLDETADMVDLLHLDIQGEELKVLKDAMPLLVGKLRRIIVATHSNENHKQIRRLFEAAAWDCEWDYRPGKRERTSFGDVKFLDGLLVYVAR